MRVPRRRLLQTAFLSPLLAATGLPVLAQPTRASSWPTQPVKLLVGFPPGSTPDVSARVLADAAARVLGQPVVVENRSGASGNIAADAVAKATDDHTLGVVINGNLTTAPMLNRALPFRPDRDFTLISLLTTAPLVLVAPGSLPQGRAFFDAAREAGDRWNYGSVGVGSVGHLGMALLAARTRTAPVHVPYPGNPQVITALLNGDVQMALIPPGLAMPQVRAGRLQALGLSTRGRSPLVPELAPLSDIGVADFDLDVFTALIGPSRLPAAARNRLASVVPDLVREPETRQRLFTAGWQAVGSAPEALRTRVRSETETMAQLIRSLGISAS
jgi:tripartite-type tricarboxylate transporter receptor subunit TctC